MTIETKYNIGDRVWYLDTESEPMPKIKELMIDKIIIHIQDKKHILLTIVIFLKFGI